VADQKKKTPAFSDAERAAMKERAREAREFKKLSGEEQVARKITEMTPAERKIAKAIHGLVMGISPDITTKTWYGMPAWAKNGKVICFFQAASKFTTRYSTLGFDEHAALDDGDWWPTAFAIVNLTPAVEKKVVGLIKKASA